jgi:hypothetical protein
MLSASDGRRWAALIVLCVVLEVPSTCTTATPQQCPDLTSPSGHPPYLVATAEHWDAINARFEDASGNARHGTLTAGASPTTGSWDASAGYGVSRPVLYVGGGTTSEIEWPAASIPSDFTVCSITRYAGSAQDKILQCKAKNWLHGNWDGKVGATDYPGAGKGQDDCTRCVFSDRR